MSGHHNSNKPKGTTMLFGFAKGKQDDSYQSNLISILELICLCIFYLYMYICINVYLYFYNLNGIIIYFFLFKEC